MDTVNRYAKFWVQLIATAMIGITATTGFDFGFDAPAVYAFIISAMGAAAVLGVANKP